MSMPTDPTDQPAFSDPLAPSVAARDSQNLSRLSSAITAGSPEMLAKLLPMVDWVEHDQRTALFWSAFPQRMMDLLGYGAQSAQVHERVCAELIADADFVAAFRRFLLERANPRFFLGHGSLTLQLDVFRGVNGPAARRQICGLALGWASSGWFEPSKMPLFDAWPIAQWLSPGQKLDLARSWSTSLQGASAQDSWRQKNAAWGARRQRGEACLKAGWIDSGSVMEVVDALLLGERPNGPREWTECLISASTLIQALGDQAPQAPYWALWVQDIEQKSKTAPHVSATNELWERFWAEIKAQDEAAQLHGVVAASSSLASMPSMTAPGTGAIAGTPPVFREEGQPPAGRVPQEAPAPVSPDAAADAPARPLRI